MNTLKSILTQNEKYSKLEKDESKIFVTDKLFERGFELIPRALLANNKISHGAVRCWAVMQRWGDPDGACWPGQKRLAKILGRTITQVCSYQKELEKHGWLRIQRRGLTRTNYYHLDWPENTKNPKLVAALKRSIQAEKDIRR